MKPHRRGCAVWTAALALIAPSVPFAQSGGLCLNDLAPSVTCAAGDAGVSLSASSVIDGCDWTGDTAQIDLQIGLEFPSDRFDIGTFVALDGGSAAAGDSCFHGYLTPISSIAWDPTSGVGPFWNGEAADISDVCGDVEASTQNSTVSAVTLSCGDVDANGVVDAWNCVSWDINQNTTCQGPATAVPLNGSRCLCQLLDITGLPVSLLEPAGLEIDPAGNHVLEAGETASVEPSWRNRGSSFGLVTGMAVAFGGPVTTAYTLSDDGATYAGIETLQTSSCADAPDCYAATVAVTASRPVHWDAELGESLAGANASFTWIVHIGGGFADAQPTLPFYASIETLLHHGITAGCGLEEYCPSDPLSRGEAAYLLVRAATSSPPPPCSEGTETFPDEVPFSDPFCPYVERAIALQILDVCADGTFCPADTVTREQMAVFVLRASAPGYTPPPAMACSSALDEPFEDVPFTSPFCPWIKDLASRAATQGCDADRYCPSGVVTRQTAAPLVARTLGLTLYSP